MFHCFCFSRHARASKRKTDSVCLTELLAFVLPQTSKQTGLYQKGDKRLTKGVGLIFEEHSGQVLLKSDKSTYPISALNRGYCSKNEPQVFGLKRN